MQELITVLAVAIPSVTLSLWWIFRSGKLPSQPQLQDHPVIFFKKGLLEYANDAAFAKFPIVLGAHNWQDLVEIFKPLYPDFPDSFQTGQDDRTTIFSHGTGQDQRSSLQIDWRDDSASLSFYEPTTTAVCAHDVEEIDLLRQIRSSLPHPAWKTNCSGAVIWYNEMYRALHDLTPNNDISVPLFDLSSDQISEGVCRIKLESGENIRPEWFDVSSFSVEGGTLHHATSRTALIRAQEAQRDFVQTLAKTFAHLSIGLAIFNRDRQLVLFNPALIDLTGLSVSFLSPRPTIDSFFDALRENRRMPEPKNYITWRQRMADLVSAAEIGSFEETWTLESGQTYSVKGRPHPDGAIAFLIEDISAEVSLTRNFRAELELGQNLVDTFEDALAVFSQSGTLIFSNKAYDLLWGSAGENGFANATITDAVRMWKHKSTPNPLWQHLQDAVMSLQDRTEWTMPICLKGQCPMQCRIVPIASGATVIRFSRPFVQQPAVAKLLKKNSS